MNGPIYYPFQTKEERLESERDERSFQEMYEKGEVCFHGWPVGQCKEGCDNEIIGN